MAPRWVGAGLALKAGASGLHIGNVGICQLIGLWHIFKSQPRINYTPRVQPSVEVLSGICVQSTQSQQAPAQIEAGPRTASLNECIRKNE